MHDLAADCPVRTRGWLEVRPLGAGARKIDPLGAGANGFPGGGCQNMDPMEAGAKKQSFFGT